MRKVIVAIITCLLIITYIVPINASTIDNSDKVILIDPGHGGIDGGAKSKTGTIEKDINLQISLKLRDNLEEKGYKVYMTRDNDEGLYEKGNTVKEKKREDLNRRVEMKKETECDIFVSIHQNMFPQSKCYGAQVWYASNENSYNLATVVQESIKQTVKDNNKRVAKPAAEAYLILRDKHEGASILVECGFLSNPDEESRLKSEDHQNLIVEGISDGIDKYFEGDIGKGSELGDYIVREIHISEIINTVKELCIESNYYLSNDVKEALNNAKENETWPLAENVLDQLILNSNIAQNENMPICQDTGMACIFIEIGQEVHIVGGALEDAINEGVRRGYDEGFLRKSVVKDPINRVNTKDNTPAIIYYDIVPGNKLKITVAPKGFGSENMSRIKMLKPSDGLQGVKDFIIETVKLAGPNPCPPIIIGVGIGGTFDKAAYLAKKALIRPVNKRNDEKFYGDLEEELLETINKLGIGPQGFGGKTTALGINIETYPTHIAGLPVAVNINCHATRHKEKEI